jgi:fructose-1,6-bisphosphatase/inositol monophosphatase family enzyme
MKLPHAERVSDWLIQLTERVNRTSRKAFARPGAGRTVARGAYGVPTASADKAAENVVIEAIADAPVPLNLFSEEVGWIRRKGAKWTLVADPIDGTRNAVRGIPFYCTCLSVCRTGLSDLQVSVVRDASTNDVYYGAKGQGSYRNGERLRVRRFNEREIIVAAALDYERKLSIKWQPTLHFRDMGSSALELCLVAAGSIDLFLSTKPYLRVVDIAASTLILREAGGKALNPARKPLNAGLDLKERIAMMGMGDRRVLKVLS